ncbi:MAG: RpiB/LacA/LacB family sugar-phosphate isomerase [Christensenellales bacterium]|jgi:ribose 5-phosphate isomerase RpiB
MKIGVIIENSTAHRVKDVLGALDGLGHEVINIGMDDAGIPGPLSYLQTGFLTGLMLNLKRVDFVVGGCGTGTGYINAALCFPGVFATMCLEPLDAWLFPQINAGNCVSVALNKGYGWGAEANLKFMFEKLFEPGLMGKGYPPERKEPQNKFANMLKDFSAASHASLADAVRNIDRETIHYALHYRGVWELVDIDTVEDQDLKEALLEAYNNPA